MRFFEIWNFWSPYLSEEHRINHHFDNVLIPQTLHESPKTTKLNISIVHDLKFEKL